MTKPIVRGETAIAAALGRAGLNTAESRLRMIAQDAMRKHHGNIERAAATFRSLIADDDAVWVELLRAVLGDRVDQFQSATQPNGVGPSPTNHGRVGPIESAARAANARAGREPSAAALAAAADVARFVAKTILDTLKTSGGRPWGDVGAHELDGMDRDGAIARAIKNKLGPLNNEQRFKTLRELMSPALFEAAWREAREEQHGA